MLNGKDDAYSLPSRTSKSLILGKASRPSAAVLGPLVHIEQGTGWLQGGEALDIIFFRVLFFLERANFHRFRHCNASYGMRLTSDWMVLWQICFQNCIHVIIQDERFLLCAVHCYLVQLPDQPAGYMWRSPDNPAGHMSRSPDNPAE